MEARIVDVLEQLVVGAVAVTERAIAAAGTELTFMQWRVLLVVGGHPEGATVGEIAERIGAGGSPTSRLISRLKRRGVVMAQRDAVDGRVTRIKLTDSGRELRLRVLEYRRHDLESLALAQQLTPREVAAVRRLAQALAVFA